MNYSCRCNFCGDYFSSDSKKEVKEHKQQHNLRVSNPFFLVHGPEKIRRDCPLVKVGPNHFARPALAELLRRQHAHKAGT